MDSEPSDRAGKGFRVLSEPLRPETLRLRGTLEPQTAPASSASARFFVSPPPDVGGRFDRVPRSLRVSCPHYSPPP